LDPFGTYSDSNLWYALETVGLKDSVEANSEKLDMFVTENGSNLSNGERQLLCLARAMLKNSKLIVMDEPTSSIDIQTDRKLQSVIRTSGRNSTIITIAHRLETIIDYDVILVLEKGNIVEFGSPANLLSKDPENENAWFARMVQEMGPEAADRLKKRTEILSVSEPSFH
jgi:ABC-type multidrug transport system fused ATPase/permease subunit